MLPLRDHLPTRRAPVVTYALIAINVVAYVLEASLVSVGHTRVVLDYGLVPARLLADPLGSAHTVVTSMFMHAPETWWHLGGNMLFLWIFGDNVEDALGSKKFILFYFLSGIAAAAAQVAIDPSSQIPMVGASGAIAGVLAAYGALYPKSPVTVLNPIIPLWLIGLFVFHLPAWLVILEFFVMNLINGLGTLGRTGGGVAFFAHLGGFVGGFLMLKLLFRVKPQKHDRWRGWRAPPRGPYARGPR